MRLVVVSLRSLVRLALITEGRVEDLTLKHPNVPVGPLAAGDPSPTKKYLEWMVKQASAGAKQEDIVPTVKYFHDNAHKFPSKDINAYRTLKDLEDAAKLASEKKTKGEIKREISATEAPKIYEDDNLLVIRPDTKRACIKYGAGSKWCITMEDASYYEQYTGANVVFYFVIPKEAPRGPSAQKYSKFAIAMMRDAQNNVNNWEIYDAADSSLTIKKFFEYSCMPYSALEQIKQDATSVPKSLLAKLGSGDAVPPEEIVAYWKTLGEGESEAFAAKCSMLSTMYGNARDAGVKAQKRVLSTIGMLSKHEPDADLHDAMVAAASGKQWMDFGGGITYNDENGDPHRDGDKPAVILGPSDDGPGERVWYDHGNIHRIGGPAVVRGDGVDEWYKDGVLHREDGPAVVAPSGSPDNGHSEKYYLFGKLLKKPAWERQVAMLRAAAAKKKLKHK